jgi:hypothetical protein
MEKRCSRERAKGLRKEPRLKEEDGAAVAVVVGEGNERWYCVNVVI